LTLLYVTTHGTEAFVDVVKGLERGRLFWNIGWVPLITSVLISERGREESQSHRDAAAKT
jgi:hypothetical protein